MPTPETSGVFHPVNAKIVAAAVALGVTVVLAGTALTVVPRHAAAMPQYTQKEGKPCGYCHVNPAGGGDRNARGKQYGANGHSFSKAKKK
jgi:hypothetical protein